MTILLLFLFPIVSRISEKYVVFVKYPVALGAFDLLSFEAVVLIRCSGRLVTGSAS